MSPPITPWIDPRAVERFRAAGHSIQWRETAPPTPTHLRVRIALLREEAARIEERSSDSGREVIVDSSPVGALVLVLEVDRDGPPTTLGSVEGGVIPGFPDGALRAEWRTEAVAATEPTAAWRDIVGLARYALR